MIVEPTGWNTPGELYKFFHAKYDFNLDACASPKNAKCKNYITRYQDALTVAWRGNVWCNPPYQAGKKGAAAFVKYGFKAVEIGDANLVCLLVPNKPDTDMYHKFIKAGALIREDRFRDPWGNVGIKQVRDLGGPSRIISEVWEFCRRIRFTDDYGVKAQTGRFASVAVCFARNI